MWIISVKRTHLDVNLKIATCWLIWNIASEVNSHWKKHIFDVNLKTATFWLIWNKASEVNSKLLQLNISKFFPWVCDITIFLQSRSDSLWRSNRKQKCAITNDVTGIENSNLGYKWQLYQTLYETNYATEKLAKKCKEPCQITAMTQISIQDI